MKPIHPTRRESTRGRLVALLRRTPHTVDEMARAVGTTDNAVRSHLTALERDGVVRQAGVRRAAGAGKPATVYELDPTAESALSHAYAPFLGGVMEAIVAALPAERADDLLRDVGRRLAAEAGGEASGSLAERVGAAAGLLASLGGDVELSEEPDGSLTIRGCACPLSVAVSRRPELCRAVETLVAQITGASVRERCDHGGRPRCRFLVSAA